MAVRRKMRNTPGSAQAAATTEAISWISICSIVTKSYGCKVAALQGDNGLTLQRGTLQLYTLLFVNAA